jgi:branched-subunit amino acid aminotransferase/4-amino-4-deoxychorismate lyase
MRTVIFKIRPFLVLIGRGGTFFGVFLKSVICLWTTASSDLTHSSAKQAILVFASNKLALCCPITVWQTENGKKKQPKNDPNLCCEG